jgi:FKBP-type peptidyl-prolyl cis-trans isomerase FkpA
MKRIILAAASAVLLLASCQSDFNKTATGLVYTIFPGKGGDSVKPGEFVKYNVEYSLTERSGKKDSLLQSSFDKMPGFGQVDTGARAAYSILEIMPKLRAGDSATVVLSCDTLKKKNMLDPTDSVIFTKGSTILCKIKIIATFKNQADAMADYTKEIDKQNAREITMVEDYMAKKGVKGIKTKSGAFVTIDNPGDQSNKADSGMLASIKYKGYLQSDGTVFDTNLDSSKGHLDPLNVTVGAHQVIPGWDEALPYFGEGGSGKIYVPSFLGFGLQGSPPVIPPSANLVFEIQILDVKPAPPVTAGPSMPPTR